jgi:hypothetical protein
MPWRTARGRHPNDRPTARSSVTRYARDGGTGQRSRIPARGNAKRLPLRLDPNSDHSSGRMHSQAILAFRHQGWKPWLRTEPAALAGITSKAFRCGAGVRILYSAISASKQGTHCSLEALLSLPLNPGIGLHRPAHRSLPRQLTTAVKNPNQTPFQTVWEYWQGRWMNVPPACACAFLSFVINILQRRVKP